MMWRVTFFVCLFVCLLSFCACTETLYKAETSDIQMEELFAEVVILYLYFEDGLANIYSQALCKMSKS